MASKRECSWPGCTAMVHPTLWGCKKHWFMLPKEIRDGIWANYSPGQETRGDQTAEYWEVYKAAHAWILANHPPKPDPQGDLFSRPRTAARRRKEDP